MIKSNHSKYNKPAILIYPGEHFVTKEDIVIKTVAGACMVVTLYDSIRRIGGIGHFIVPGQIGTEGITQSEIASYGVTQLEYLFGEFVKLGGDRKDVKASVFGGATVSATKWVNDQILTSNARFMHDFFSGENIIVDHLDISGSARRKIIFFPQSGKTYRKMLSNNETDSEIIRLENKYIEEAHAALKKRTEFVLFKK